MRLLFCFMMAVLFSHLSWASEPQVLDGLKLERMANWPGDKVNGEGVSDLTVGAGGIVLYVKDGALIVRPESGKESQPLKLPNKAKRMYMSRNFIGSGYSLYIYGCSGLKGDKIFVYEGKGKFTELLSLPQKVTALTVHGDRVIFALDSGIYGIRRGQKPQLLFTSPLLKGIQSLDIDGENDIIYLATKDQIFSLRSGTADILIQGLGGFINHSPKGLLIRQTPVANPHLLLGSRNLLARTK